MHKTEAANLFQVLSDEDRVKMIKKLYMMKSLTFKDLSVMIESSDSKLNRDLDILLEVDLINKDGDNYIPNIELIDELMNFIKTPCGCHKKTTFTVVAYDKEFVFEKDNKECAWYDFDHAISQNGESELRIDANRDVYAFYKENTDSEEIQGTIRDEDDNILADNYGVDNNYKYHFVISPKQGYFDN